MPSPLHDSVGLMSANLDYLYRLSSEEDKRLGKAWYPAAHRIIIDWAETYERSIANVACIVAALSPQCEWTRNLIIADDILAGRQPSVGGALGANVRKAESIRDVRASDITLFFPHGPKVASFAANLAGDWSFVTVDSHAYQAAIDDCTVSFCLKLSAYTAIATAYTIAARRNRTLPAHFQAVLWHTWKRLYPAARKRSLIRSKRYAH